jgi:hypothetical protein
MEKANFERHNICPIYTPKQKDRKLHTDRYSLCCIFSTKYGTTSVCMVSRKRIVWARDRGFILVSNEAFEVSPNYLDRSGANPT